MSYICYYLDQTLIWLSDFFYLSLYKKIEYMSMIYCEYCDEFVDTDYNVEHFIYQTEDCVIEVEESKIFISEKI